MPPATRLAAAVLEANRKLRWLRRSSNMGAHQEVRMLSILGRNVRLCDGISRRDALRIGGLGFTGLMWADHLRAAERPAPSRADGFGRAKACILIFNYGG